MSARRGLAIIGLLTFLAVSCQPLGAGSPAASEPDLQSPPPGVAVDLSPRIADRPTGGEASLVAALPVVHRLPAWTLPVLDEPGGRPVGEWAAGIDYPVDLVILGSATTTPAGTWYRAFPLSNQRSGPADLFGWVPADPDGRGDLGRNAPTECPLGDARIAELAAEDPFTRARCLGAAVVELDGWAGWFPLPVWYDVSPAWMGKPQQSSPEVASISLHATNSIDAYVSDSPSIDLQLPPGLALPPYGFKIAATFHAADPVSRECRRSVEAPGIDTPPEAAADSVLWCTTRLVLERWTPLLGPEGRAIDPRAPQLHRHPASPPGVTACAGVGMPPLTFHVDPSALDPVWLEAAGYPGHIIPSFDPSFRAIYDPQLVIVDAASRAVVRDGTPLDPDGSLDGHPICPMGAVVSIGR